ncbi:MAG: hypothetical protein V9G12_14850 [Microthrixaceae bacterium]
MVVWEEQAPVKRDVVMSVSMGSGAVYGAAQGKTRKKPDSGRGGE